MAGIFSLCVCQIIYIIINISFAVDTLEIRRRNGRRRCDQHTIHHDLIKVEDLSCFNRTVEKTWPHFMQNGQICIIRRRSFIVRSNHVGRISFCLFSAEKRGERRKLRKLPRATHSIRLRVNFSCFTLIRNRFCGIRTSQSNLLSSSQ